MHEKSYFLRYEDEFGNVHEKELLAQLLLIFSVSFFLQLMNTAKLAKIQLPSKKYWLTKNC